MPLRPPLTAHNPSAQLWLRVDGQACLFEAMVAGQQHLIDLGYNVDDSEQNEEREDAQQARHTCTAHACTTVACA